MQPIIVNVSTETIAEAQRIRKERDEIYGNIFVERAGDMRWVGEIGEICFNTWLQQNTQLPIEWIQVQKAAHRPDFLINGIPVGMKTVKRQWPVKTGYTAQITAKHADEPVAHFFFASYEYPKRRLWLLGGATKEYFLDNAHYYKAGDKVHDDYVIRPGHEIYNIDIDLLTPPRQWIASLN
jgi:hypothetical protein